MNFAVPRNKRTTFLNGVTFHQTRHSLIEKSSSCNWSSEVVVDVVAVALVVVVVVTLSAAVAVAAVVRTKRNTTTIDKKPLTMKLFVFYLIRKSFQTRLSTPNDQKKSCNIFFSCFAFSAAKQRPLYSFF